MRIVPGTGSVARMNPAGVHFLFSAENERSFPLPKQGGCERGTGCGPVPDFYRVSERMRKMIAHCGLDCSKCEGYIATRANDAEALAKVAAKWSAQFDAEVRPEDVICDGCRMEGRKSAHCGSMCEIRKCCLQKQFGTCIECGEFPCEDEDFVLKHAPYARENLEELKK